MAWEWLNSKLVVFFFHFEKQPKTNCQFFGELFPDSFRVSIEGTNLWDWTKIMTVSSFKIMSSSPNIWAILINDTRLAGMTINLSFDQIIKTILKPLVFLIDHHIDTVY